MVAPKRKALTARQRQVAALQAMKLAISEIAQTLDTSEAHVSRDIRAIKDKLSIEGRLHLRPYVALPTRELGNLYYNPEACRKKQVRIDPWLDSPDSQTEISNTTGEKAHEPNDVSGSVGTVGIHLAFQNERNSTSYLPGGWPAPLTFHIACATRVSFVRYGPK